MKQGRQAHRSNKEWGRQKIKQEEADEIKRGAKK
jgi:hypothetical protein